MESQVLDNFFTTESLLSLQGAAAAALLIPNVLVYLIPSLGNQVRKWISFTISMLLAYLVAILAPDPGFVKWVLAFFNGFLMLLGFSPYLKGSPSTPIFHTKSCAKKKTA